MDKEIVAYMYTMELLSRKKEGSLVICNNVDGP